LYRRAAAGGTESLEMPLHDVLEMIDDPPKAKRATKRKRR
jgi:hypothetical protein